MMSEVSTSVLLGDCLGLLSDTEDDSVDLIITSPPYGKKRAKQYGGIDPDKYVEWFLPRSEQFFRVLKSTGTFILNIKEWTHNGQRHTYVLELILALKNQGWLWTEEMIWSKKNCFPGKWPNRFRDAWERLLQFNKARQFRMFQEEVMVPVGDWRDKRRASLNEGSDRERYEPDTGTPFGRNMEQLVNRDMVYPSNVLLLATECSNRGHSAAFPEGLPEWFIKLFTEEGDMVLDPFCGSGTTCVVARRMGRRSVGMDISEKCCQTARERLKLP